MMKKFLYISLFTVLLIGLLMSTQNANKKDVEDTNITPLNLSPTDLSNLLSLGFTEEEINNMTEEEFNLNKGLKGDVVEKTSKYYKVYESEKSPNAPLATNNSPDISIQADSSPQGETTPIEVELTPEQYYAELDQLESSEQSNRLVVNSIKDSVSKNETNYNGFGQVTSSYKTETLTISKLDKGSYRVKLNVHWDSRMPKNRKVDALGIKINNALWKPDSGEYAKQTYKIFNTKAHTNSFGQVNYLSSSNKWKRNYDGYAVKMDLKDDLSSTESVINIGLSMYYTVTPLRSTIPKYLEAYATYAHQETKDQITPSISFGGNYSFTVSNSKEFKYTNLSATLLTY